MQLLSKETRRNSERYGQMLVLSVRVRVRVRRNTEPFFTLFYACSEYVSRAGGPSLVGSTERIVSPTTTDTRARLRCSLETPPGVLVEEGQETRGLQRFVYRLSSPTPAYPRVPCFVSPTGVEETGARPLKKLRAPTHSIVVPCVFVSSCLVLPPAPVRRHATTAGVLDHRGAAGLLRGLAGVLGGPVRPGAQQHPLPPVQQRGLRTTAAGLLLCARLDRLRGNYNFLLRARGQGRRAP